MDLAIDCAAATFAYDNTKPVCDAVDLRRARRAAHPSPPRTHGHHDSPCPADGGRRRPSSGKSVRVLGHDAFTHTPLANQVAFIGNEWGDEGMNAPVAWMARAPRAAPTRSARCGWARRLGLAALLHQDTAPLSSGSGGASSLLPAAAAARTSSSSRTTNLLDVTARAALLDG